MNKIVLYCKSYNKDVYLAKRLLDSIIKYNTDNIPFFISVPSTDVKLFKDVLGTTGYYLIKDEEIDVEGGGWIGQQIVKSQFWKMNLCENYVCIDSDCFFIKSFTKNDFMFDDTTPYTICHEYKSFFEMLDKLNPLPFDPYDSFIDDRLKIMDFFDRSGVIYDFGPGPTIWSSKVWKSMHTKYIEPNDLTFTDLIKANSSEFTWYGEWLLYDETIRLLPRGPIFKNYHYPHMYDFDKKMEYDVEKISKLYLGIGLQSIYEFN